MTGYTVHTGSSEKFSEGWDKIFGGSTKKSGKKSTSASAVPKKSKQSKSAKPTAAKKRSKGK